MEQPIEARSPTGNVNDFDPIHALSTAYKPVVSGTIFMLDERV
jgi:hypothetical protein